jgi:hypothetical protein
MVKSWIDFRWKIRIIYRSWIINLWTCKRIYLNKNRIRVSYRDRIYLKNNKKILK